MTREELKQAALSLPFEPGVYLNGKFGVRIEDSVVMKDGKPSSFMKTAKYLQTVKNGKLIKYVGKGK